MWRYVDGDDREADTRRTDHRYDWRDRRTHELPDGPRNYATYTCFHHDDRDRVTQLEPFGDKAMDLKQHELGEPRGKPPHTVGVNFMVLLTWIGILFSLSQSAVLSGLNLAVFTLSKLELEVEARKGNARANRILALRENPNFAFVTMLWGNVAVNALLALLSNSVLSGVAAFLFTTVVITIFAEIIPGIATGPSWCASRSRRWAT